MNVPVLFFGATADIVGQRRLTLDVLAGTKVSDLFEKLILEYPHIASHKLHISINQQYAKGDEIIRDGDELAIFTAVSGG